MWQRLSADVRVEETRIDIADTMLSRAADMNVDLIAMGAYGHSHWTERILGGATRGLLATKTVPVLMSHRADLTRMLLHDRYPLRLAPSRRPALEHRSA